MKPGLNARRKAGARRRVGDAGFTLVEVLVSLVILGFVMSLVSEAVFQVAQIARAADANSRALASRWGAGWSASSLFANLLAPSLPRDEPVLTGDPARVSGYTSLPLDGGDTGITRFELMLQGDPDTSARTLLSAMPTAAAPGGARPTNVATFSGRAEFGYVDRQGAILDQWPPLTRTGFDPEDLPQAVVVREAGSGKTLMWYAFQGETIRPAASTLPIGLLPAQPP